MVINPIIDTCGGTCSFVWRSIQTGLATCNDRFSVWCCWWFCDRAASGRSAGKHNHKLTQNVPQSLLSYTCYTLRTGLRNNYPHLYAFSHAETITMMMTLSDDWRTETHITHSTTEPPHRLCDAAYVLKFGASLCVRVYLNCIATHCIASSVHASRGYLHWAYLCLCAGMRAASTCHARAFARLHINYSAHGRACTVAPHRTQPWRIYPQITCSLESTTRWASAQRDARCDYIYSRLVRRSAPNPLACLHLSTGVGPRVGWRTRPACAAHVWGHHDGVYCGRLPTPRR